MKSKKITPDTSLTADITLRYPLSLADGKRTKLTMRRPNMGDLLDYEPRDPSDIIGEATLIGILCGLKLQEMRHVDPVDYARLQDQYVRFRAVPDEETDSASGGGADTPDALGAESH